MQRITITIEDDLLAEIDAAARERGYQNRSEVIRDLARAGLQQSAEAAPSGQCVAALVYVYDHAARDLSKRLVQNFHGHHDLSLATLHVHLDDDSCMEVTALKGSIRRGPAFRRSYHRRTRRALWPRGDDPDRGGEEIASKETHPQARLTLHLTPQSRGEGEASHAAFAAVPHGNPARAMPP